MNRGKHDIAAQKSKLEAWHRVLRDELISALEACEPQSRFQIEKWRRGNDPHQDLGGGEMALLQGEVIEKAGVHISTVYGTLEPEFRKQIIGTEKSGVFWASGISMIVHPRNPHAPTAHFNTRMIVTGTSWFGGGGDLTPMLTAARTPDHPDTADFHTTLRRACDAHDSTYYARFKEACDVYFFLPHRNEPRGTGGIFFDHFNSGDWARDFAFVQDVGRAFADIYPQLIMRRAATAYSDSERNEQLHQRGRYVEFNLLYDRGTMFGLKTGGNVKSILSSLPPHAMWT